MFDFHFKTQGNMLNKDLDSEEKVIQQLFLFNVCCHGNRLSISK